jgi:hypothetical protein
METNPTVDARLSQLQEIPLPAPVAYVPATIGWAVAGVLLLLALGFACWRIIRHRRLNAYRRDALAELARIEANLHNSVEPGIASLPALLKRTAIAASSRNTVASLTGDDWLRFLDRTMKDGAFERGAGRYLPRLAYASSVPADLSPDDQQALIALSRQWIRSHRIHHARSPSHADV